MNPVNAGWLPVDVAPLALLTWFAPGGPAVASLASWLAVIGDARPRMRAGCGSCGLRAGQFPDGADFVVNVPGDQHSAALHVLISKLRSGETLLIDQLAGTRPARKVHAPLLAGCELHLECAHGCLSPGDWDTELDGDLLLLHRAGTTIAAPVANDICTLWPFRTSPPG